MNLVEPFALTEALLPVLRAGAPARIVNVASQGISIWKGVLFSDIHARRSHNGSVAYARSKYMNILWTFTMASRLEGSGIVADAVHPKMARTPMIQSSEARVFPASMRLFWPIQRLIQRSGSPEAANMTGPNTRPSDAVLIP